jgi:hypothetical protein
MDDVRKIYAQARTEFVALLSALEAEIKDIMLVLDSDICSSNGDTLTIKEMQEIHAELLARKRNIDSEISFVKDQIALVDSIEHKYY